MRKQDEPITKIEQKRQVLIGFSNYTNDEIDAMSDDEVREVYHKIFS